MSAGDADRAIIDAIGRIAGWAKMLRLAAFAADLEAASAANDKVGDL